MRFDPSLYLVTDPLLCRSRGVIECVEQAVRGGVTAVQLRDKKSEPQQVAETARALVTVLKRFRIPLIINDYPELVEATGAQGAHIGLYDGSVSQARERLPPGAILGVSVDVRHTQDSSTLLSADYIAASPVFPTATKTDCAPPFQMEGMKKLRASTWLPIVGIGGIQKTNIESLLRVGVDGFAIVSAILDSDDITHAARELADVIQRYRQNAH